MTHHNPPNSTGDEASGAEPILISVKEAARLLNLTPWSVYEKCNSGVLASGKDGRRRMVSKASVKEYADQVLRGMHAPADDEAS